MKKYRLLITVLTVLLLGAAYYGWLHDKLYVVVPGRVYRSAQLSEAELHQVIVERRIRSIVNLRGENPDSQWYRREKAVAARNGVRLYDIWMDSHRLPLFRKLNTLLAVLMQAERPVLVHCWRGSDRTGLTAALLLVIETDPPLPIAEKQLSWRYGVIPGIPSVGRLVFDQYRYWRRQERSEHSRTTLIHWIRNAYRDDVGNYEFRLEAAGDVPFNNHQVARLPSSCHHLDLSGWIINMQTRTPPKKLRIELEDLVSVPATMTSVRPDVLAEFGLEAPSPGRLRIGWRVAIECHRLTTRCYRIFFRIANPGRKVQRIPTGYALCLETQ